MNKIGLYSFILICCIAFFPVETHAYIDLGLAGQFFQAIYLVVVGALAFALGPILFFWKNIRRTFAKMFRRMAAVSVAADDGDDAGEPVTEA